MRLLIALLVALAVGGAALFVIFTVGAVKEAVQKLATDAGAPQHLAFLTAAGDTCGAAEFLPIGQSSDMPVSGCVSGCVPNTNYREHPPGNFRTNVFTIGMVWSASLSGRTAFRGRNRDAFSESRMR